MPLGFDLSLSKLAGSLNKQLGSRKNEKEKSEMEKGQEDTKKIIGIIQKVATSSGGPGIIIVIVLLLIFIFFLKDFEGGSALESGGGNDTTTTGTPGGGPTVPQIPGLTIILSAPAEVANGTLIEYTVKISYDSSLLPVPIENIELFDNIPPTATFESTTGVVVDKNSNPVIWKLSEQLNRSDFTFYLRPKEDVEIINTISARITSGIGTGAGSTACTQPFEGTGYCSAQNLLPIFSGDPTKALIASMICQAESSSNPFALNTVCNPGIAEDYSVGLFQINLTVHCPGAYANSDCTQLIDAGKRAVCEETLKDPIANIQKMFALSAGTYWTPWSTWPGVQSKLQSCGIL